METALYYTFSTIPQVVEGAIAFLGAFALFRMQFLNREIERSWERIGELIGKKHFNEELRDTIIVGEFQYFYIDVHELAGKGLINVDCLINKITDLHMILFHKQGVIQFFWISLILNVVLFP